MEEPTSLDDLLNSNPEPEAAAPAPVYVTTQPRDDQGRFASSETGVDAGEPEEPADPDPVPPTADKLPPDTFKAVKDEREKRQALERQLAELQQQIQAQQNPPAPPPSIWEDEQGAFNHFGGQIVSQAVQQATMNARLDMSEMMVRQQNPDFDDMKARFLQMAEANPMLRQQALSDPHPWNKAYTIAKNAAAMESLGSFDVDALKAKIRDELMAEMQAQPAPRPAVPPTLTGERNVGARSGPAWAGPASLSDLLR